MYRINYDNVEKYMMLENQIKDLTKVLEEMKADFITQMKTEGITEKKVANGKGKVTYTNTPQNRFNQKKFGADHPDLLEEYKELADRWSLRVNK